MGEITIRHASRSHLVCDCFRVFVHSINVLKVSHTSTATSELASGASALRYVVFEGVVDRTAEATTNFKDSEEVLCELVGLEEYDLATRVDEAGITAIASHAKTFAVYRDLTALWSCCNTKNISLAESPRDHSRT